MRTSPDDRPVVSVIIAVYGPGADLARVIGSLDAQTLPQGRFESIFVDDGSPDDAAERLAAFAADRPNLRVERIAPSGWPSRPRNVGVGLARGDWVLFVDHDDALYPDALRRLVAFAEQTGADLVSPKESKTSNAWWGIPALTAGNAEDVAAGGRIDRILPMVPHKLYRRAFLLQHGITFPEGPRQLWEDIRFNVDCWRHAEHVAVLADTPVYLWHSSGTNNSKTYGPESPEYWDRLESLCSHIDAALAAPEHAAARRTTLLHQYRSRILGRLAATIASSGEATPLAASIERARALQAALIPVDWERGLDSRTRARAHLLRKGEAQQLVALEAADAGVRAKVVATAAAWNGAELRIDLVAGFEGTDGRPLSLRRRAGRIARDLPPALRAALPEDVVDVDRSLTSLVLDIAVRERRERVTWQVEVEQSVRWADLGGDRTTPIVEAVATVRPLTGRYGAHLPATVFDLRGRLRWDGLASATGVLYEGPSAPALLWERPAIAYRSNAGTLALDLSATLRSPAGDDAGFVLDHGGPRRHRSLALPRVAVVGAVEVPVTVRLTERDTLAATLLQGSMRSDGTTARLAVDARRLPAGAYLLATQLGADGAFLGRLPVTVDGRPGTPRPVARAARSRLLRALRRGGHRIRAVFEPAGRRGPRVRDPFDGPDAVSRDRAR